MSTVAMIMITTNYSEKVMCARPLYWHSPLYIGDRVSNTVQRDHLARLGVQSTANQRLSISALLLAVASIV